MPTILAIDDDPKIIEAIRKILSLAPGFVLESVSDPGKAIPAILKIKPDIVLLDVRMPGGDGRQLLKAIKENAATRSVPVIFLTGMSAEGDKVLGLNLGADDYVVKPFGAMELLARVQAVLRRAQPSVGEGGIITVRQLELDPGNRAATLKGKPLKLQPKEFEILYLLAAAGGRTRSRQYLVENSSSYGLPVSSRSLDTHIKNIRRKLGALASLIETVPKLGYRLKADDD